MSIDMRRARTQFATQRINLWAGGKTKDHVKALPVLVRTMGIASAIALEQNKPEGRELASDLVAWLTDEALPGRLLGVEHAQVSQFLVQFTALPSGETAHLENEGLLFAETLKLIAGALKG